MNGQELTIKHLARALAVEYPIFLLDEPTSALDAINCQIVVELLIIFLFDRDFLLDDIYPLTF